MSEQQITVSVKAWRDMEQAVLQANRLQDLEKRLLGLLKGEHSSLTLSFNDHASNYCTVAQAIEQGMLDHGDWISEDEKRRAIETNRVWSLHWYPNTPVGFHDLLASSLQAVVDAALADDEVPRPKATG